MYPQKYFTLIFKSGMARPPGFLKLFLCGRLYVYVFMCVSAPEAIND